MVDIHDEAAWEQWVDHLAEHHFLVIDEFISEEELRDFQAYFQAQKAADALAKAGIGSQGQFQIKAEVRGDYIKWLDPEQDQAVRPFFDRIEVMMSQLNRYCYLSLRSAEFHLAHYPKGTFYKRHLDQFSTKSNRLISVILYLNDQWQPGDGGELRLFLPEGEKTIAPIACRVAILRSNLVEHEVLETHKDRYSITGWLKTGN